MGEGGLEPPMPKPRIYSPLRYQFRSLSHKSSQSDLNQQPADYKSAALPIEPWKQNFSAYILFLHSREI